MVMGATPTTRPSLEQSVSVFLARHNSMPQPTLPNPSHFLSTLASRSHVGALYCGTTFIPLQVTAEAPCNVSVGVCTEDGGKTWACNATALINGTVLDKVSDSSMRPKLASVACGWCVHACVCARACAVPNVHVCYVRVWWSCASIAASIVAPEGEALDARGCARCSCPAVHVPSCRECSMHARHRSSHRSHRPLVPQHRPLLGTRYSLLVSGRRLATRRWRSTMCCTYCPTTTTICKLQHDCSMLRTLASLVRMQHMLPI